MILYDFEYERPKTLSEAASLLAQLGPGARAAAGGTDILPNMRLEIARPSTLVSLKAIAPPAPCMNADGTISIHALTTLAGLADSELIKKELPMLAESAHVVASNQVRQMGTIGGNLCQDTRCMYLNQKHDYQFKQPCFKRSGDVCYPFPRNDPQTCWSVHMSDTAPALIALNAEIETVRAGGARRFPLEALFTGKGLRPLSLEADELVQAIIVPARGKSSGWGYYKSARRGGLEYGLAVMAATLRLDRDGRTCAEARIVIGGVREKPVRALDSERKLVGNPLTDERVAAAAAEAAEEVKPLPHHGFTKSFLTDNIRIHLRRTLARAAARASEASAN